MERMGIYIFYDRENHVDRYVDYMLESLRACVSKLYVVCNSTAKITGLECIERHADKVFFRENVGFDAGAYKDFFCRFSPWDEWEAFDEVVLANDTFYGPFYPLGEMFHKMKSCSADFWSATWHPGGRLEDGKTVSPHCQSWFLVVKSTLFKDKSFREFWQGMEYPGTLVEAIECFEIRFTEYFRERGFRGTSYMSGLAFSAVDSLDQNPYIWHSYELVSRAKVPFFKKKCLSFHLPGYTNAVEALSYIEKHTDYDTGMIWENIYRLCGAGESFGFDYRKLETFYRSCNRVYIYGAGEIGRKLAGYFAYRNWVFEAFLETEPGNAGGHRRFMDVEFESGDGVIIAVGKKYVHELMRNTRKRIDENHILLPVI